MTLPLGLTSPAVDALRDKIRGLFPAPAAGVVDGVAVYDGPAPEKAYAPRWVSVAAAFETNEGGIQDAVTVERTESGARPSVTERLIVACSAYAGGGDVILEDNRAAAGRLLTAINGALMDDRTLGDVVDLARLGDASWGQLRDGQGSAAIVNFTVELVVMS